MVDNVISYYGGLKHAYSAYVTLLDKMGSERSLPGFEGYSPKQMFWIAYTKLWCTKYETKSNRRVIVADNLMSNDILVEVLLRSLPEFSNDFECKAGDFMAFSSNRTCVIW